MSITKKRYEEIEKKMATVNDTEAMDILTIICLGAVLSKSTGENTRGCYFTTLNKFIGNLFRSNRTLEGKSVKSDFPDFKTGGDSYYCPDLTALCDYFTDEGYFILTTKQNKFKKDMKFYAAAKKEVLEDIGQSVAYEMSEENGRFAEELTDYFTKVIDNSFSGSLQNTLSRFDKMKRN